LPRLLNRPQFTGVRIGRIVALQANGKPLVDYPGNAFGPVAARVTASVKPTAVRRALERGGEVLLAFGSHNAGEPILFDVVRERSPRPAKVTKRTRVPAPAASAQTGSACLGRIVAVQGGEVCVDYDGNETGPMRARATVPLRNLNDAVLLQFLAGGEPVIVGQLYPKVLIEADGGAGADVVLKGRRVRVEAETEIELVAGGSKMQLDARGKVVTTAEQVVSRARGANKVQGGCVQLN
jgi:hypothetical protein